MSEWKNAIGEEANKEYYKNLSRFVNGEYRTHTIYPPRDKIMRALDLTPPRNVKCVILGQDPYHEPGQAMGLSFSVEKGVRIPPSLLNIYKELQNEFGYHIPETGDLTAWAQQGVLLLNAILTVRAHEAASHRNKGWEEFTDAIIKYTNTLEQPIVYMLWGNYARSKKVFLNNPNHLVLESVHPSPLSANRGFLGCGHFKRCNEFLESRGVVGINWNTHEVN